MSEKKNVLLVASLYSICIILVFLLRFIKSNSASIFVLLIGVSIFIIAEIFRRKKIVLPKNRFWSFKKNKDFDLLKDNK